MDLRQDIEEFFQPRVHDYLNKEIKRGKRLFSPSDAVSIIKAFEQAIDHLESPEPPENDYEAILDLWKKTFTRNVLVPKYLMKDPHLELEEVLRLIKQTLHKACQEVKTEAYVRSFRQTIVSSLRNIPPLERMKRARQILSSSIKVIQKLEKNFSKEAILAAFPKDKLQELVDEAAAPLTLPCLNYPELPDQPLKHRIRQSHPKPSDIDIDKLQSYLKSHLITLVAPTINAAPSLLAKLQVVSGLFARLEKQKELLTRWITEWAEKPTIKADIVLKTSWEQLPLIIKQIRAEVLAHSCLEEIMKMRMNSSFVNFAKEREDILDRYIRCFLQEPSLKELFLEALREEERTERERFLPPSETPSPPSPKAPNKKSLWQKV